MALHTPETEFVSPGSQRTNGIVHSSRDDKVDFRNQDKRRRNINKTVECFYLGVSPSGLDGAILALLGPGLRTFTASWTLKTEGTRDWILQDSREAFTERLLVFGGADSGMEPRGTAQLGSVCPSCMVTLPNHTQLQHHWIQYHCKLPDEEADSDEGLPTV
ncbi:hypothetical protein Bbelb_259990 [Branchiostoma belcheri]|nr:hypothetical protein Bbelb_259990 [Branchiostoma belcheri]